MVHADVVLVVLVVLVRTDWAGWFVLMARMVLLALVLP